MGMGNLPILYMVRDIMKNYCSNNFGYFQEIVKNPFVIISRIYQ